jgi:hypothetical protein
MTLHQTQVGALAEAAATVQTRPIGNEPVVVRHAAFAVSPASFDEITRLLRARMYHHVFDPKNGAIYMDSIALTRGEHAKEFCSAFVLENNKPGGLHRYLDMDEANGELIPSPMITDKTVRFAREQDARGFAKLIAKAMASETWEPIPHLWG